MEKQIDQIQGLVHNPKKIHPIKYALTTFHKNPKFYITSFIWSIISTAIGVALFFNQERILAERRQQNLVLQTENAQIEKSLKQLEQRDEYKVNITLEKNLKENHDIYESTITVYEDLADLPATSKKLPDFKTRFALILKHLSDLNNSSASSELKKLSADVGTEKQSLAAAITAQSSGGGVNIASLPTSNTPPGSGYSRQTVDVNGTKFAVDIVAGNLSSTRVIVDTATDGDCKDNCPVLSVGEYASRNGAYAAINGSYFCPADYPSCAGKVNTFDTLAMNKNKKYINSDNNVYSTVPAMISGNGFLRFVGASQDWGRDTGVDGVLANQPLMVSGGKSVFGGDTDPKKSSGGTRGFIANKGGTAYIGFVHGASVTQAALVLEKMGMDNALNLDSGGSVALWANGGYKVGPGRSVPNSILFVNK